MNVREITLKLVVPVDGPHAKFFAERHGTVHDDIVLVEIVEEQVRDATEVEDDEQE